MSWPRLCRALAIAIAIAAAVDPGCVRARRDRPLVSVIAGSAPTDSVRALEVQRDLASRFTVVPGWLPAADLLLLVGDDLPAAMQAEAPRAPVFALLPSRTVRDIRWRALRAPERVRAGERVLVQAHVGFSALPGDSLELSVRRDGLLLARETVAVAPGRHVLTRSLPVVATDSGAMALEVTALLTPTGVQVQGVLLVDVVSTPVQVLSLDVRPTWFGTFVRRALSADARFAVVSRTTISRTDGAPITRTEGAPPALSALPAPPALDVIVVGAAQALEAREVDALDAWVQSGGSAVLLLDDVPAARVQRWLDVPAWRRIDRAEPQRASFARGLDHAPHDATDDGAPLLGRQWLVPTRLPRGGAPWMMLGDSSPVVWSIARGAGTVVVAGALDAWAFREGERSDFATLWPRLIAEAASRVAPAVSMRVTPSVAPRGAWRRVEVDVRDDGADSAAASWRLTRSSIPTDQLADERLALVTRGDGRWSADWRDEAVTEGVQPLRLSAAAVELAVIPMISGAGMSPHEATHPSVLRALAEVTGGRVLDIDAASALGREIDEALRPATRQQPWHPMRSPWWLLPFVGALLAEWWLRRRAGRP